MKSGSYGTTRWFYFGIYFALILLANLFRLIFAGEPHKSFTNTFPPKSR